MTNPYSGSAAEMDFTTTIPTTTTAFRYDDTTCQIESTDMPQIRRLNRSVACALLVLIGLLWQRASPTMPILVGINAHAGTLMVTSTWQWRRSIGDLHWADHSPIDAHWEEQHSTETTEHSMLVTDTSRQASLRLGRVLSTNHDRPHHQHTGGKDLPIMHTFYIPIEDKLQTGMSDEANQKLIEAWTEEWRRHGCEARVIGMETAQQHPDFEHYNALLDGLDLSTYERYCFLRYLAMAVVSGGWMCDFDTFPLHPHDEILPNGGQLTVHEYSKHGGVPSLVSGSKDEFNRFAALLIDNAVLRRNEAHWSDIVALHDVFVSSGGTSHIRADPTNVIPGQVIAKLTEMDRICTRTDGKFAIHFSRYAMEHGGIEGAGPEQRADIAQAWLKTWRTTCLNGVTESG